MDWLPAFVRESNRIEGILRAPTTAEIDAHALFTELGQIMIDDLIALVGVLQPDARLRDKKTVPGVRVGRHVAPPSGLHIRNQLLDILELARFDRSPYDVHRHYETLHPFTDGNGRSGRALWLWMMLRGTEREQAQAMQLGFLHTWYYQSLEAQR